MVSREVSVSVAVVVSLLILCSVAVTVTGDTDIEDTVTEVTEVTGIFLRRVVVDTDLTVWFDTTVFSEVTVSLRYFVETDVTVFESVSVRTLMTVIDKEAVDVSFFNFLLVFVTVTGLMV